MRTTRLTQKKHRTMKSTKRNIDRSLKRAGFDGEILKGDGYVYFASPSVTFHNSMVMTSNISDLSVDEWLDEYRHKLEES